MQADRKIAVVTGAGSGIGRAVSLELLRRGWHVALCGRRAQALDETCAAAGKAGERALAIPTDICDAQQIAAFFSQVQQHWGRIDLLFNNAGTGAPPVEFDEIGFEQWQQVVNVNLTGVFLCSQHAFRIMKNQSPQGGRIINNGSISAHAPRPNSAPYTATKHAVTGLTKAISLDGRPYGIACGQIDIGNAATEMTDRMANGIRQADGSIRVEPRMDVQHVADAVAGMADLPLSANVQFMTIMATNMPFVGRG